MSLVIYIIELIAPTVRDSMDFCQPYLKEPSTVCEQHEKQIHCAATETLGSALSPRKGEVTAVAHLAPHNRWRE